MSKILNYLIIILVIGILIVGGIITYRLISFKEHTITIKLNGASSVTTNNLTCGLSLNGCIIKLPQAKKDNGKVVGYSFNKDNHQAEYKPGDFVKIDKDYELFIISSKDITISIDSNNTDFLEKNKLSCTIYNANTSCKIKMPLFNKKGYQLEGYSTKKEVQNAYDSYFQNQEYEFSNSMTLYPNYTSKRSGRLNKVYNTTDTYIMDNKVVMEFENGISSNIIEEYKTLLNKVNSNLPQYLNGTKITVLTYSTFLNMWGGNGNVLGINYSKNGSATDYPVSRSLDMILNSRMKTDERYYVLIHELGHSFDFYYGYGINKPTLITTEYSSSKGNKSISSQSDIKSLFNKYRLASSRPLRDYAYNNVQEFVAESLAYYYLTFIDPVSGYDASKYPNDLKTTIEKYLCVAKNNYDTTKC